MLVTPQNTLQPVTDSPFAEKDPLVPTIFHEPWWLEIATGGKYGVVEAIDDGATVGRLPYLLEKDWGITRGVMPHLSHFLGPAVIEGEGSEDTRFLKRLEITRQLIHKLPPASGYSFKCHRGVKDAIAFQREKFITSVQFTHEVAPRPTADIWKGLQHKRRSVITRAAKNLTPVEITDPEVLINFMQRNLKAYNRECIYDMKILRALAVKSLERGCGRIMGARDPQGDFAGATFCIWDSTSYYLFVTARAPSTYRGSLTILVWEAMKDAAERCLIFDMDGLSTDESVAFFTGFGATIVPRYIVTRESPLLRVVRTAQSFFLTPNYYC